MIRCRACKRAFLRSDAVSQCPSCLWAFHDTHLREGLKTLGKCPNCRKIISPYDLLRNSGILEEFNDESKTNSLSVQAISGVELLEAIELVSKETRKSRIFVRGLVEQLHTEITAVVNTLYALIHQNKLDAWIDDQGLAAVNDCILLDP